MKIRTKQQLIDHVNYGSKIKYVYFWGHRPPKNGISKSCFSQWYESPFTVEGVEYQTAEHFMMAEKAKLFGDNAAAAKAIAAKNPGEAKQVGRQVKGFDELLWANKRFEIVVNANYQKFSQNSVLKEFLVSTSDRVLVEASPVDKIWGIGLAMDHQDCAYPNRWKGLNLLGFALMEVRDRLLEK